MATKPSSSPASVDFAIDSLVRLVEVIGSDRELRAWFARLEDLSAVQRRNAIFTMSEQLQSHAGNSQAIVTFRLLADPRVFSAAWLALAGC